ncbi:MAG TPA: ABC transporter permease, partial [Actinomycetota bacterium]|nr:ABC transporter permease [Actinomycetota bacterium]
GGRAVNLLIMYSVLMGITTFLLATNSELSLIPPKEMVFLTLLASISFGIFVSMIIGADSVSGERERRTLEALLLTPASRRQIVVGKFLAALSPWPAALLISLPALVVVSQGNPVLGRALALGALMGTLLALAFTSFGVLVSIWSNSNRNSMFICLIVWLLLLLPTQLPGEAQKGSVGDLVQMINPMEATSEFLEKILVNNRTFAEKRPFFWAGFLSAVVLSALLVGFAAPRLRLEGGRPRRSRAARLVGAALSILSLSVLVVGPPAAAGGRSGDPAGIRVEIDRRFAVVKTGDEIGFTTVVTNEGPEPSPPLILAMNIINVDEEGDVVDPEDWSPERTQYLEPLAPGASAELGWTVEAILKGDYLVYLVAVPQPAGERATSTPVSSPGLHLTVRPFARLNPKGVLPVAIFVPLGVTLAALALVRLRLRRIQERDEAV